MRQQTVRIGILAMLTLGLVTFGSPLWAEDESPGRQVLIAQKCNLCHAVSSVGIEAKTKSEKLKGPDLAGVGANFEAEWLVQYIKKEVKKDGKAHTKPFKGTDEELQTLIDWLLEQKAPDP